MAGAFDISASGALIWSSRTDVQANQPTWFDLDGRELGKLGEPGTALQASFSKDGRRLVTCERTDNFELWMTDVATGVRTRFSFGEAPAAFPCWSPDMRTVYFATGAGTVLMQASDGATPAKVVLERKGASVWPESATPDGSALLCAHQRTQSVVDIVLLPLDGRGEFKDVIGGPGNQASTAFSPDGRWLAYETDESGRNEVVVVRYPSLEGRWQLSSQGGHNPQWHPDGRSVIYRTPDSHVVRVAVDARGDGLVIGGSTTIFGGKALPGIFDLSPDGRLLVFVPQGTGSAQGLNLVTDWRGLVDERD
jgi:Tol biopolymer transport system component